MSKVRREIELRSAEDDKPILLWLLSNYSCSSKFSFLTYVTWIPHPKGYAMHGQRVWHPTPEGRLLYKYRHELKDTDEGAL